MDLLDQQVIHAVFGTGKIVQQKNDILSISFSKHGKKCFIYPDAFEKHLKLCAVELEMFIHEDIESKKAEEEAEKERAREQVREDRLRKEEEKADLLIQKKKTASKAKSTKTKKAVIAKAEESQT